MSWIQDLISPKTRKWEDFYRNRWQHDKVVRSTHGVNCTGGCSWNIHVKDGIVVWETQALDYPRRFYPLSIGKVTFIEAHLYLFNLFPAL